MSYVFSERIQQLAHRISKLENPDLTPFAHCSKLNSVLLILKDIPGLLLALPPNSTKLTMKQVSALTSLYSVLDQLEELFRSCRRETCVQFLLSTPVTGPKYEISALRDAAMSAFRQLGLPDIAKLFEISEHEINEQDMVDMKRIVQILIQVSLKQREDANHDLAARFASLKKMGLEVSRDDTENVTIPELPANLRLVVKHEDVELGKQIGKGQSGTVYLGKMKKTGEEAAVKVLFKRSLTQPELESFKREIFAMSILNHPSLLKFMGYTEEAPFYLITEYMGNGSLFDILRKKPESLTPTLRSVIALQVARGLEYLHGKGVIHRDLKSLNILMDKNNHAKICDFGMARTGRTDGPKTGMIGTAHWMAPEVLMSSPDYDQKVDVYSFGIFMWELLTGDMPYKNMKQTDIMVGVTMGNLRPTIPDDCPQKIRDLIEICWSQDPAMRPKMSKVVSRLSRSNYHFPGTEEGEFQLQTGVVGRHRSARSQMDHERRHRSKSKQQRASDSLTNFQAPEKLIHDIDSNTPDKDSLIRLLTNLIRKKDLAEKIAAVNGNHVFVDVLSNERNELVNDVLHGLLRCKCPDIFDVSVLKVLLTYKDCAEDDKRQKAMECLMNAANMRLEFLTGAPSFLVQLLGFLSHPLDKELVVELLHLTSQLIPMFNQIPEGLVTLLVRFWSVSDEYRTQTGQCIIAALTSKHCQAQSVGREDWLALLKHLEDARTILSSYCQSEAHLPCDHTFVKALFELSASTQVLDILAEMAKQPRFSKIILGLLPVGEDTRIAASIYIPFMEDESCYPVLVKIPEFYAVASYLVATGKIELACQALKKCDIVPAMIGQTRLCEILAQVMSATEDERTLMSLMAAIFSISKVVYVPEFAKLLPKFVGYLFGSSYPLRKPSFLCIAALSTYGVDQINYDKLLPVCAFYANSDSALMREVAATILRDHVCDKGINLAKVVRLFLDSFSEYDPVNTPIVLDALAQAVRATPIDPALAERLSALVKK